jgi:Zn-dependent protease
MSDLSSMAGLIVVVISFAAIIISLTIHEFFHGFSAKLLGDDTAESQGRLTLNPLAHIDPFGTILLPLMLSLTGLPAFGWARPVPVNPYNFKNPKSAMAIVSVAGPLSNLLLAILALIFLKIFSPSLGLENLLIIFLYSLVVVNAVLLTFNLIPLPPLDGSKVLFGILPDKYESFKYWLSTNGPYVLFGIIIIDSFLGLGIFNFLFGLVLRLLNLFI